VLDDEALVRESLRELLALRGLDAVEAADAAAGLDLLHQRGEAVVGAIIDLTLPDMDGREVARRIVAERSGFPIVLSSGYPTPLNFEDLGDPRRLAFVQKPFRSEEFWRALEGVGIV